MKMDEPFEQIKKFHGHLGPYVVIGYRMGIIANQHLGNDPFGKNAVVWTDKNPPGSCIIDGIQISSGCTLGKGNISVKQSDTPKAVFSNKDGKQIQIVLKPSVKKEIDAKVTDENMLTYSLNIFRRSKSELFDILGYI
jgi:formylmethanofuran dehydrogenase subunit E